MGGFPRSTWPRSVRGPLPCENWSIFRIQWAAHDASHAWAEAEATRRWDRVDRPCFLLAVYDRAEELERHWQREEIPLPFDTYEQWQASLNEFLVQACEEAWQALDDAEDSALPGHAPTLDPPDWPEVEKFCLDVFSLYFHPGFHAYTYPTHIEDTNPDDIGSFDPNLKYDEYKNTTLHIIPWSRFGCPSDDSDSESDSDSDATSTSGHNDANAKQKATGGLKNSLAKTLRRKRKHSADSEVSTAPCEPSQPSRTAKTSNRTARFVRAMKSLVQRSDDDTTATTAEVEAVLPELGRMVATDPVLLEGLGRVMAEANMVARATAKTGQDRQKQTAMRTSNMRMGHIGPQSAVPQALTTLQAAEREAMTLDPRDDWRRVQRPELVY